MKKRKRKSKINRKRCSCGKAIYETEEIAEFGAFQLTRFNLLRPKTGSSHAPCRTYKCYLCGSWHITSQQIRNPNFPK